MPKLLIHVEAINTAITEDDTNVAGVYAADIMSTHVTNNQAAELALRNFHRTIPIRILDDFKIRVLDLYYGDLTELTDDEMDVPNIRVHIVKL